MPVKPVTAVILSAGRSTRMEQFKPLLNIGGKTVIERCISMFSNAGIRDIRVVVGHFKDRMEQMEPALKRSGVRVIANRSDSPEMFSSVRTALQSLESHVQSIMILPGDVPLVRPWTVNYLIEHRAKKPQNILVPCFQGKRGHPVVIPADLFGSIRTWDGQDGLKGAIDRLSDYILTISVGDANILFDMDTPEDYEEAKQRWIRFNVPTKDESLAILRDVFHVDETIIKHGSLVADVAGNICDALVQSGYQMDKDVVTAAGLLHDMAKGKPRHEKKAARALDEMGFPEVASAVSDHTDIECADYSSISSSEVLYLADKLVKGNTQVTIDERFQSALHKFGHDSKIKKKIEGRMKRARIIINKVTHIVGHASADRMFMGKPSPAGLV